MENCRSHQAHDEHLKRNDARIGNLESRQSDIKDCLNELKEISRTSERRLEQMENRIAAIEAAPGKRWEHVTNYALAAAVGGLVGYMLSGLGVG